MFEEILYLDISIEDRIWFIYIFWELWDWEIKINDLWVKEVENLFDKIVVGNFLIVENEMVV